MSAVLPALPNAVIVDLVRSDRPLEANAEHQRCEFPDEPNFCKTRFHCFVPHVKLGLLYSKRHPLGAHIWDPLAAAECRLFPAWICFLADLGSTETWGDELIISSDLRSPTFVTTADNVPVARIAQYATLPAISATLVMADAIFYLQMSF